jgi:hypothetical protein
MKRINRIILFSAAILYIASVVALTQNSSAPAVALLRLEGENLSGKKVILPDDAHGKIALLVIGFSKKSGDATRAWGDRFKQDFGSDSRFAVYPVAELEGASRFIRGMIVRSMRRGTPAADRDRFVTLFEGSETLKRFVAFSADDDAYLLLLDVNGTIQWRGHGIFREQDYPALQVAAKKLASQ